MNPKTLCPELSVDKQLTVADVAQAKADGYRAIVNARPDNEEPGQPSSAEIEAAAKAAGLAYAHIPVVPGQIGDDAVAAFDKALETLPHPILGFCKSGMRACSLWALARCGCEDPAQLIAAGANAGYDLAPLAPRLHGKAGGKP